MTPTDDDRREVAARLREYAELDFSDADPWWYMQKALCLPEGTGPGVPIPFRGASEALCDLADLVDPDGGRSNARITGDAARTLLRVAEGLRENVADAHRSCQAQPVYYGIIEREAIVTADGYQDFWQCYDEAACCELTEEEMEERRREFADANDGDDEGWDSDLAILPMRWHRYIVRDRLFLTRREAEEHLRRNRHHYSPWAHTYAMTAWRSPQYEELVGCLISLAGPVDQDGGEE